MRIRPFRLISYFLLSIIITGLVFPSLWMHTKYIPLGGDFEPSEEIAVVDHALLTAKWTDHLVFIVDSPGGMVMILDRLREDMRVTSSGYITAYIPYFANSCAAWFTMDADQVIMEPDAVIGFHYGEIGNMPLSAATLTNDSLEVRIASAMALEAIKEEPSWLFTKADWDLMNSGGITQLTGSDFYKRRPWNYTINHVFNRDLPHLVAYLETKPEFVKIEKAVQSELDAVQSFLVTHIYQSTEK